MERWLKHERYRPLAERDDQRHRFAACLCPIDPGSIALVEELLGELAPCFASDTINVGLDETFQIGTGRSAHVCAERGVGRVYADYLLKVHAIAERMGKRIQFWADMVLGYDDVPAMIPADATAMVWGYEADHPFERQARQMASVGLPFYVCPGSSAWNSITGRTANMLTNVDAAVAAGLSHGAAGLLQTDWGDNGHLQPLPISYPGLAYAAARSWCAASNDASKLASQIDAHVLYDRAGRAGAWLLEAGDVALLLNQPRKNGTPLFDLLMTDGRAEKLDVERERYAACREALATLRQGVDGFDLQRDDAGQVAEELRWACDLLIAACDRGLGQLDAATVHELTDRHRQLWLQRNRPGGLDDSVGRLNRLADAIA
jgi:hypothetical protein